MVVRLSILIAVLGLAPATGAWAASLSGTVVDLATGQPVAGATVQAFPPADPVAEEPAGAPPPIALARAVSAADGAFVLDGVPAVVDVTGEAPGFTRSTLRGVATGGAPLVLRLLRGAAEAREQEMIVTAERERIDRSPTVSSHRVEEGVVDRTPGSLEDVTRAITLKPGIVPLSDFAPIFSVRGGDVYQTWFFLDDILIFNPFQPLGGGTIFNPDLVRSAEIYTGGQLASFPEALSGILAINYRDPRPREDGRPSGILEASMISVNSRLEGGSRPDARGMGRLVPDGWLLSARRSDYEPTLELARPFLDDLDLAAPVFLDLFAKGVWEAGSKDRVALNLMYVQNTLQHFQFEREESGIADTVFFDDRQTLGWVKWTRVLGPETFVKTNLSRVQDILRANATGTDPIAVDANVYNDSLRVDLSHAPETGTAWDTGLYLNRASFVLTGKVGDFRQFTPGVAIGGDPNLPLTELFPERSFWVGGAYGQYKHTLRERLTVQPGLRLSWNDATHEVNVGPRLNVALRVGERHVLKGAWGLFHQPPFNPILLDPTFGNPDLKSEQALHWVAGYEGEPLGTTGPFVKVEAFWKDVFDQVMPQDFASVDFANPQPDDFEKLDEPFLNEGRSTAYGFELSASRQLAGRVRAELNYSWLKIRTTNPLLENESARTFSPYFDQRHTANLVMNWRPDDAWTLSATGRFGSGKPFTPVRSFRVEDDVSNDHGPRNVWVPDELGPVNSARYPAYARLDLRAERLWHWGERRVIGYFELLNAQVRSNTEFIAYTAGNPDGQPPEAPKRQDVSGLPTLPFLGARVEF